MATFQPGTIWVQVGIFGRGACLREVTAVEREKNGDLSALVGELARNCFETVTRESAGE